jgi:hypothetical protein
VCESDALSIVWRQFKLRHKFLLSNDSVIAGHPRSQTCLPGTEVRIRPKWLGFVPSLFSCVGTPRQMGEIAVHVTPACGPSEGPNAQ